MSSTKVQSTIKFRIRKPASVSKCSTSPVEDKIYRMKLRTPTPSKVKEDGKKLSVKKSGDKFSRNLFDADKPKSSESSLDVSPTKQRKSSSNENSQSLATSQPSERAKLLLNASYVENLVFVI
ncbi:hypothetical protein HDE_07037 [Halotydeus destructor]|nr:hypothetical protein HDE_07037 [Halotydeus destructor]